MFFARKLTWYFIGVYIHVINLFTVTNLDVVKNLLPLKVMPMEVSLSNVSRDFF